MLLLMVWTLLAEWHRWVWVKGYYNAHLIEAEWRLRDQPPMPNFFAMSPAAPLGVPAARIDLGRLIRWSIAAGGITIWANRLHDGGVL
jgi:hypothetical protein